MTPTNSCRWSHDYSTTCHCRCLNTERNFGHILVRLSKGIEQSKTIGCLYFFPHLKDEERVTYELNLLSCIYVCLIDCCHLTAELTKKFPSIHRRFTFQRKRKNARQDIRDSGHTRCHFCHLLTFSLLFLVVT